MTFEEWWDTYLATGPAENDAAAARAAWEAAHKEGYIDATADRTNRCHKCGNGVLDWTATSCSCHACGMARTRATLDIPVNVS